MDEIKEMEKRFKEEPHKRELQKALAEELTTMIHGKEELQKAEAASQALFTGAYDQLDEATLIDVFSEAPSIEVSQAKQSELTLVKILVESKLCPSNGQARKDIKAGAIYINNDKFSGEDLPAAELPLLHSSLLVLRRGKKNYCLVRFT